MVEVELETYDSKVGKEHTAISFKNERKWRNTHTELAGMNPLVHILSRGLAASLMVLQTESFRDPENIACLFLPSPEKCPNPEMFETWNIHEPTSSTGVQGWSLAMVLPMARPSSSSSTSITTEFLNYQLPPSNIHQNLSKSSKINKQWQERWRKKRGTHKLANCGWFVGKPGKLGRSCGQVSQVPEFQPHSPGRVSWSSAQGNVIQNGCRIVVFLLQFFFFLLSFPVPFALYLQQFGTRTCCFAWYLLHFGMVTLHFGWYLLHLAMCAFHFGMVFVIFWQFNLSFTWYISATFWCLKRSCGSLEGSLGFHF